MRANRIMFKRENCTSRSSTVTLTSKVLSAKPLSFLRETLANMGVTAISEYVNSGSLLCDDSSLDAVLDLLFYSFRNVPIPESEYRGKQDIPTLRL